MLLEYKYLHSDINQSSRFRHFPGWLLRSWGNARSSHLPPPKVNKERGIGSRELRYLWKNEFSEPRGLHLPIHRKLNSLTLYLFIFLFLFFLLYFTLQLCIGFAIHWHQSTTGVHEIPNMNPPPTSLPTTSLWVIPCTSPKHAVSCIRHRLVIRFLHDSIHVPCHSPKSSHPLPLPLSPKVRYTHLCLFCCLAYRVVIAIFLNSIYMC